MLRPKQRPANIVSRDPERTRQRILAAALKEFAVRGFAGARVGAIARRARINKRMLYHYFQDKNGLFRSVLRHKINERMRRAEEMAVDPKLVSSLPQWFRQNCQDADWVRLLAWESLQSVRDSVLDEKERRRLARQVAEVIRKKQEAGRLRGDVPPHFVQLAKISLTMLPVALPQLARLIVGCSPRNRKFQEEYGRFLETISVGFRPSIVVVK